MVSSLHHRCPHRGVTTAAAGQWPPSACSVHRRRTGVFPALAAEWAGPEASCRPAGYCNEQPPTLKAQRSLSLRSGCLLRADSGLQTSGSQEPPRERSVHGKLWKAPGKAMSWQPAVNSLDKMCLSDESASPADGWSAPRQRNRLPPGLPGLAPQGPGSSHAQRAPPLCLPGELQPIRGTAEV